MDRTRYLNAQQGDANVSLTETIYKIVVNGVSTPDMAFLTDTSYRYIIDEQPDTLIITQEPIAALVAVIRDLSVYPVTEQSMFVWPHYTLIDTLGTTTTDTLWLDPTLIQDSLLVYNVTADTRTYTNPDNTPRPWILWADDDAYVNSTFPLNPPTIGVATLDGMDRTGWPYEPDAPNMNGLADKLTSVPINLAFPAGDSIYLSFFCEPIGRSGDQLAHGEDSLRLELFAPDENNWYQVWTAPGNAAADTFRQVMVPITDPKFLKSNFKMRFSNYATLGGAVDQWHIDYVRLDRNRTAADTVLKDVAYVYEEAGLLQTFTSVPYAKFIQAPASYMAQQVDLEQRNNDTQDKFITWGYGVTSDCGWSASRDSYGNNISNNAGSHFNSVHPVNSGADPLVYDVSACADAAFLTAKFWTNATPDVCAYNDTMAYVQEISNYYSYDDGTAEAGYSLNQIGAKQAYRFDTEGADSLRALRMYFDPIFTYNPPPVNHPPSGSFIITVWSSLDPEVIVFQNISFNSPQYHLWGPDHYVEYPLDSTIAVSGTFYVGWVQTNDTRMNLGLDKNRDNHDKMFFKTGLSWSVSAQEGSWMIRPVMVAAVDPFAGVDEIAAPEVSLSIWPNPSGDTFHVQFGEGLAQAAQVELIDPMGRSVRRWIADGNALSVQDVASGPYIVRLIARDGHTVAQGRLIVQH
ncbi:MAG: T9SS type A sorting domain-containing protein [Flavobacteriales bacterium]|nr:T9SS type A sorting domain-containing protein [Flavobacteriales bacterium]